jgi:hypothetical protein
MIFLGQATQGQAMNNTMTPAIFAPEAVVAINRAYLEACEMIAAERSFNQLRFKLAEHIMYLARNGESDPERLRNLSVIAVLGRKPERLSVG